MNFLKEFMNLVDGVKQYSNQSFISQCCKMGLDEFWSNLLLEHR